MIICGIIQSPEKNSDFLIVRQIAGEVQASDVVINAQINLTSRGNGICQNGIRGWRKGKLYPKEFYLCATTNSKDCFGRSIILGIYLKKEKNDSFFFSKDTVIELLNSLSLEMEDSAICNIVSFIRNHFTGSFLQRNLSCSSMICGIIVLLAVVLALLAL